MKEDTVILLWLSSTWMISTVDCAVITYNAALNKTSYQSSVMTGSDNSYSYPADLANDGKRVHATDAYGRTMCSTTDYETNPWWAVDLGHPVIVYRVDFTDIDDVNAECWSKNFVVGLTNVSPVDSKPTLWNYTVCGQYPGDVPCGQTVSLYCQNDLPPFRYVIVQLPVTNNMYACEVEVLVPVTDQVLRNVAINKPSSQISTHTDEYGPHPASLANDGSRQTDYTDKTYGCAASNAETNPWWAVDLGAPTLVVVVSLTNRGDAEGHRSNNFIVGLTNRHSALHAPVLWNYTLCGQYPGAVPAGHTVSVQCAGVYYRRLRFRYVIVQFPLINEQMNFCEVEVFTLDLDLLADSRSGQVTIDGSAAGIINETSAAESGQSVADGTKPFIAATVALSVIAGVVILVLVILLVIMIKKHLKQRTSQSGGRTSAGLRDDYSTIPERHTWQ